jgi:hypothetical protein
MDTYGNNPDKIDELHHFSRWAHCTTKQFCLAKKNMEHIHEDSHENQQSR